MSGLVLTIDDGNPLLTYQPVGAWAQHNSSTDPTQANNFHGQTLMVTQTPGATVSFVFEGVNIVIYGTKSPQHGNYTVNIDGIVGRPHSDQAASIQYNEPIYISEPLNSTTHTITILNENTGILDIDYITWTPVVDSNKNGTLSRMDLDDIDPVFNYYAGSWSTTPSQVGSFHDNTGHSTSALGSAFNLTFLVSIVLDQSTRALTHHQGDAVSLYGSVGPSNGVYSVQLDDQLAETFVATEPTYVAQTLLYYGSNLGPGNHTLHVVNEEDALLEIDYAEVFTLPFFLSNVTSAAGSPSPTETTTSASGVSDSGHDGSSLSTGAIVGMSIGVVIALVLALFVGFCKYLTTLKRRWIREREALAITSSSRSTSSFMCRNHTDTNVASSFRSGRSSLGSPTETPISEVRKPIIRNSGPIVRPSSLRSGSTLVDEDGTIAPITWRRDQPRRNRQADPNLSSSSHIIPRQATSGRYVVDPDQSSGHTILGMRDKYPRHSNISPLVRESQLVQDEGDETTSESQGDVEFAPPASTPYSGITAPPRRLHYS